MSARPWSAAEAEEYLLGLELFGMRFGLDRMQRLLTALGSPQRAFEAIHVVGTNGKSSTVRMIAAILEAHGVRTGCYLSPHLASFAERVRIGNRDLEPEALGRTVQRAAAAAAKVDRTLEEDDRVTQFEALTASAFSELARRGVEAAVIEAGLGGRYDATNVLDSRVQVLTNVGLEHTRWLGPTVRDIAIEKLDVVRPGGTLVVGELHPDAREEAVAVAARRGARLVEVTGEWEGELAARGAFQRRNFALARAAAGAFLGELEDAAAAPRPGGGAAAPSGVRHRMLDDAAVVEAARTVSVPGRFEVRDSEPLTIFDGAHNPAGAAALARSLPGDRRLVLVLSILDDKDAAAMLRELLPRTSAVVFTSNPNPRALSPATLQSLANQLGLRAPSELEPDPHAAVARARALAGPEGVVLATGSIYLIAALSRPRGAARASTL